MNRSGWWRQHAPAIGGGVLLGGLLSREGCWSEWGTRGDTFGGLANVISSIVLTLSAWKFVDQQRMLARGAAANTVWREAFALSLRVGDAFKTFLDPSNVKELNNTRSAWLYHSVTPKAGRPSKEVAETKWETHRRAVHTASHSFQLIWSDVRVHFGEGAVERFRVLDAVALEIAELGRVMGAYDHISLENEEKLNALKAKFDAGFADVEGFVGPIVRLEAD